MKSKLFYVAVILHPTDKQAKDGEIGAIVVQPTVVLASDEKVATLKAHRLIPEEHVDKTDRLEVAVRPF